VRNNAAHTLAAEELGRPASQLLDLSAERTAPRHHSLADAEENVLRRSLDLHTAGIAACGRRHLDAVEADRGCGGGGGGRPAGGQRTAGESLTSRLRQLLLKKEIGRREKTRDMENRERR
jgi:hypothetical protein